MAASTPEPERDDPTRRAAERIVRLAYWVSQRSTFTIAQATLDVPGYAEVPRDADGRFDLRSGPGEALRKLFQRDLAQLDERFGIEVGYHADAGEYRVAPPFFTPRERQMVLSALALVEVAGIDDDGAELERLGRALDASGRRVVVSVHAHLQTVRAAIAERHPIAFRYHGRDRVLEPWVIGQWRNHWYVVGHERSCGERRVFRLDRIETADPPVRVLDDHYEPPLDVEPRDELRLDPNDWGRDPETFATVDVHPEHAARWRDDVGGAIVAGDAESSWVRVEVLVRDRESFRDRVLRMGTHARVHGPPEIVALVDDWLTELVQGDA